MTDTIQQITPAPGPDVTLDTAAVQSAPVVVTPTAPVEPVQASPTPVETPTTPVVETPVAAPVTLLGEETPVVKTETNSEVKPAEEQKTTEPTEGQSDEPASPPIYDQFAVPEGVTLEAEQVGKFTEILGKFELDSKADHAMVQKFGQEAVDFHVKEIQRTVEDVYKSLTTTWEKQKTDWRDAFIGDSEIGGNRFQTTVDSARNAILNYGGTPEQQAEFRQMMETSGLGNHPAMIRLLNNVTKASEEGRPLAASRPVQLPKSKVNALYGQA